jgi:beta-lactamase regulating signal transducer with metallopeptidase domain/protocatechuate 3,4-dioxygenase beta subunit
MTGRLAELFVDDAVKATLLLLVAWVVASSARRSSAALRHRIWALALCGAGTLPLVSWLVPGWRLPVLPAVALPSSARLPIEPTTASEILPDPAPLPANPSAAVAESSTPRRPVLSGRRRVEASATPTTASKVVLARRYSMSAAARLSAPIRLASQNWTARDAWLGAWCLGAFVVAVPTLLGLAANEVLRRRARRVEGVGWRALLDEARAHFGIRREVELRESADSPVPLTWGIARPVVLLPDEAETWPEPTRRLVLLHELAHVRRLDAGLLLAGRLVAAVYWFHPLAWYALRRLRLECEHAVDDCVVLAGARPTDYARQLLELARSLRLPRLSAAVPMARINTLELRMKMLFDRTRYHGLLGPRMARWLAAGAVLAVLGLATAHLGPATTIADEPVATKAKSEPPKGTGKITGAVVQDTEGKPAGAAEVVLLPPPPDGQFYYGRLPLRSMKADSSGHFAFEGLAPGRYRVWANQGKLTSRKGTKGGAVVVVPKSGDMPKPVELRLKAGILVTVKVTDRDTGKPLPKATIAPGWSDLPEDFTTDGLGVALVQPLTPERWFLEAWADGHEKRSQWVNLETGTDAEIAFRLGPGSSLEGVVRGPDEKPLAGVGISIRREGEGEQFDYMETGPDGRYAFLHLPLGAAMAISFSKEGYLDENFPFHTRQPRAAVNLALKAAPDGGSVTGLVVDHEGRPLAGAEVVNRGNSSAHVRETKTGADGRFRLDNLYENFAGKELLVRGKGCAPKRVRVETGPRAKPAEVKIALELGHRIKGRVVDEKGRPLDGVIVDFAQGRSPFSDGGRANTDKQGRFGFDALPLDCPFGFSKEGFSDISNHRLPLDTDEEVEVVMVPAGVIAGKVLDAATGKPVRAFNVRITFSPKRQPDDPQGGGLLSSLVNPGQNYQSPEGRFQISGLVAGMPLQVMIAADGYEPHVNERIVAARGDQPQVEEFRLDAIDPASLQTYRGRLVDAKGKPVAGAQLRLIVARNRDPNQRAGFPFNWQMIQTGQIAQQASVARFQEAITDGDGRFRFAAIPKDAEVELVWWGKGITPGRADHLEDLDDKGRDAIELKLPVPSKIVGKIDRAAYPQAGRIEIRPADGAIDYPGVELKPGQTDYEVGNLVPGEYQVTMMSAYERAPGGGQGLTSRSLGTGKVTVEPGETARVDFEK